MSEVIVAREKHGTFTYESALALLRVRLNDGYWYDGPAEAAARTALEGGEDAAWKFLDSRSDHEYEYVELQEVRQ